MEGLIRLFSLTIFGLLIAFVSQSQARRCSSSHHRLEFLNHNFSVETIESIARGNGWERIETPANHHAGIRNDGLYRIHNPNGNRIIKIFGDRAAGIPGGSGQIDPYFFQRSLVGMALAEGVGGPRIYRAGKLRNPETGQADHYIEMEELFAGQTTFTFKATRFRQHDIVDALTEARSAGSYAEQMARLFAKVTEQKIIVDSDIDFIFSASEVRWIDTGGWTYSGLNNWGRVMDPIRTFIRSNLIDGMLSEQFVSEYLRSIELSQHLSLSDKAEIARALNDVVEW